MNLMKIIFHEMVKDMFDKLCLFMFCMFIFLCVQLYLSWIFVDCLIYMFDFQRSRIR